MSVPYIAVVRCRCSCGKYTEIAVNRLRVLEFYEKKLAFKEPFDAWGYHKGHKGNIISIEKPGSPEIVFFLKPGVAS